jgi:hypothetical protein
MDPINQKSGGSNKMLYIIIGILVVIIIAFLMRGSFGSRSVNINGMNLDVDKKIDGSTTIKSDYGTTTVNQNKLPDNWPTDVPAYASATITTAGSTNAQAGVEGMEVMFNTKDSAQSVLNFYKSGLTSSGWASLYPGKPITGTQVGANISLMAKKDKRTLTVSISDMGIEGSRVVLIVASMPTVKTGL